MIGRLMLRVVYRLSPRHRYKALASRLPPGARVVDIGGGPGIVAVFLDGFYVNLDPEPGLLRLSPHGPRAGNVVGVGEKPPFRGEAFTHALLIDVVHHSENPLLLLRSAASLARCRVLVEDVDAGRSVAAAIRVAERLLGFPAKFLALRDVAGHLEASGFSVRVRRGGVFYLIEAARPGCLEEGSG